MNLIESRGKPLFPLFSLRNNISVFPWWSEQNCVCFKGKKTQIPVQYLSLLPWTHLWQHPWQCYGLCCHLSPEAQHPPALPFRLSSQHRKLFCGIYKYLARRELSSSMCYAYFRQGCFIFFCCLAEKWSTWLFRKISQWSKFLLFSNGFLKHWKMLPVIHPTPATQLLIPLWLAFISEGRGDLPYLSSCLLLYFWPPGLARTSRPPCKFTLPRSILQALVLLRVVWACQAWG